MTDLTATAFFPFCGMGAGALGFLQAEVSLLGRTARFRSLGGIDNDALACEDFRALTSSPCLRADVAKLTAADLLAFCPESPDVVFSSPPCTGFSGLLGTKQSKTRKYRALNRLVLDWTRVMLEAWAGRLPGLVLIENVPRIESRGRHLLRKVKRLLRAAGYVFSHQTHDCGELGGLAQHRRRFLLVARLPSRISPLLYQPITRRVRACGEVLGELPMPNDPIGGPLHKMPRISWLNWVRLALIPAGGDWRDLPGVLDELQARREVHKRHAVEDWNEPTGTVGGSGSNGVENVADPRPTLLMEGKHRGVLGVKPWDGAAPTITGNARPVTGAFSVADPRVPERFKNSLHVGSFDDPARTVTSGTGPTNGGGSVADPRVKRAFDHGYRVLRWDEASFTIHGNADVGTGAYSVADIRVTSEPRTGTYGVLAWDEAAKTVTGVAGIDNGAWAVADPRHPDEPPLFVIRDVRKPPPVVPLIIAKDGTWHRPLTTLELAALQGLPAFVDGKPLQLAGSSATEHRKRIGNAVPPPAARAIAEQMLIALVEEAEGAMLLRGDGAVWVVPALERTDAP
jgi:site-specific DNA-cytosine methylase